MSRSHDAYPMLARCARHQLPEDGPMYRHLTDRARLAETPRPNLILISGRNLADRSGTMVPMLQLKAP